MKKYFLLIFVFLSFYGCELDSFLFNSEPADSYQLPGNNIPDSLIEEVIIQQKGSTIYGFWVKAAEPGAKMTILYNHGNKHGIDEYWDRVMFLHSLGGVNVFIYDYKGYGRSTGESSEKGLQEDAESAFEFVSRIKGIPADSLILYGYSLGNYPSIYLAANKVNPRRLIAESPFASANSLTQGSAALDLPERWLTEGEYDNAENIKKVKTPFLLLHGENDDFVRYSDNGRVVFENAPEPKKLVLVKGAVHTNVPQTLGVEDYKRIIREWIWGE